MMDNNVTYSKEFLHFALEAKDSYGVRLHGSSVWGQDKLYGAACERAFLERLRLLEADLR